MMLRGIWSSIATAIVLTACASPGGPQGDDSSSNLIPMYGHPAIEKSAAQKKADEDFIKTASGAEGSREKASKAFAAEGWRLLQRGDTASSMRRFNQSWLLNPNDYLPYWGFGALLFAQRKPSDAATHFEKALSLITEGSEKPRLLRDASRAYTAQGAEATDKKKAEEFFGKANLLLDEAITLNPTYGSAYGIWAISLYYEGNYLKAWAMVKQARGLPGADISSAFINMLSKKLPEPQ
jgi:tetratricopeptide (TPR) repeat protein